MASDEDIVKDFLLSDLIIPNAEKSLSVPAAPWNNEPNNFFTKLLSNGNNYSISVEYQNFSVISASIVISVS